jgi:molybdenum ABC transporter molybdate-binding protein
MVYVPCVLSGPVVRVVSVYQEVHPDVEVRTKVEMSARLLTQVGEHQGGPAAVITTGDVEMRRLAEAGAIAAEEVRTFAVNDYALAVVVPAEDDALEGLADLALAEGGPVLIESPSDSTMGDRTEEALKQMGLWRDVAPKVVRPDASVMVLSQLLDGDADAVVVFEDCLFGEEGSGGSPPRTIRILGRLPEDTYTAIPYQVAALQNTQQVEVAQDFVSFLSSAEGRQALSSVGLTPSDQP